MKNFVPHIEAPLGENDDIAALEAMAIESGIDLEIEARKNTHQRSEAMRFHLHWIIIGLTWIAAIGFLVMTLIWLWHLLTPAPWHFLPPEQLKEVQNILFSSGVASVLSGKLKSYL